MNWRYLKDPNVQEELYLLDSKELRSYEKVWFFVFVPYGYFKESETLLLLKALSMVFIPRLGVCNALNQSW